MTRRLVTAACITAVVASVSACSGGDKAGGDLGGSVTLTVAAYDESELGEFVAVLRRLSGGPVRLRVVPPLGEYRPVYDTAAVADVRRGELDLAIVDARTLDRVGATSFRAALAPFLVDSLALEERVLEGPIGRRMLAGVDKAGLVGVGVLPGPLRRPVGFTRSLTVLGEFRDAVVGTVPFSIASDTFRLLGARAVTADFPRATKGSPDGADVTVAELDATGYEARSIAADVVLWPHVLVVVANEKRFRLLSEAQQALLRRASREAIATAVARIRTQELAGLARICEREAAELETTTRGQRTALLRAVNTIYDDLAWDPLTSELLGEIQRLRSTFAPDVLRCAPTAAPTRTSAAGPLDGTWEWAVTKAELRAVGETPTGIANNAGRWRLVVDHGRFELRGLDAGDVYRGIFLVRGDRVVARIDGARGTDPAWPTWQYAWSLYRDQLIMSPVENAPAAAQVVAKPLIRVD